MGKGAVWIIGLIYTLLGGLFLVLGLVLGLAVRENGLMIGGIFAGIGGIFFVLGVIFLLAERRKAVRNRRLVEAGRYIVGEIADLQRVPQQPAPLYRHRPVHRLERHSPCFQKRKHLPLSGPVAFGKPGENLCGG